MFVCVFYRPTVREKSGIIHLKVLIREKSGNFVCIIRFWGWRKYILNARRY
jgi:hypothetical protein